MLEVIKPNPTEQHLVIPETFVARSDSSTPPSDSLLLSREFVEKTLRRLSSATGPDPEKEEAPEGGWSADKNIQDAIADTLEAAKNEK